MANFFDQFDQAAAPAPAAGGNFFDQFEAQPSTWEDIKKYLQPANVINDVGAQIAGIPGNIAELIGRGGTLPTTEDLRRRAVEMEQYGREGVPIYQPQTRGGKFTQAVAGALPTAPLGVGGIAARTAQAVIPALASEAAGQATEGTPYETAARLGTGLVTGYGAGRLTGGRAAAKEATALEQQARVTPQQLIEEGGRLRDAALASNVAIDPKDVLNLVAQTRNELNKAGRPRSLAGGAHNTIDELEASANEAIKAGKPLSANDVLAYRETMTQHTKGIPTSSTNAAGRAKGTFDDWLRQKVPTLASLSDEANANFRGGYLGAEIASPVNRATLGAQATNSGMNVENRIRSTLSTRLAKEEERAMLGRAPRFAPETQQLMREVVEGTPGGDRLRRASNILGGGGGAVAGAYGFGGGISALLSGNPLPLLAAAAPIAGHALKRAANKATIAKADKIAQSAMGMAPMAQARQAAFKAQIAAARDAVKKSKMSASQRAVMLQALQRMESSLGGAVGRAEDEQ